MMDEVDVLCQESQTCLEEEEGEGEGAEAGQYNISEDDGCVEILLESETSFGIEGGGSLEFNDTIKCARLEAITWILKTRAVFRFRYETAYLSLSYFDRFLSRRIIKRNETSWACKLLAVACLSLAAKLEEVTAPALSEFQFEGYNFESSVIQRMELLVLNTLKWKMITVTPFASIHYLATKFCRETPSHVASSSVELVFSFIREESLINHRPSAIAAAAALMAVDHSFTRESLEMKLNSISHYKAVNFEDVVACYNFMQKMKVERLEEETPNFETSPDLSPNRIRPLTESPAVTATVTVRCKRRRLKF